MDPKAAALALVEANRTPAHRKMVRIAIDDRGDVRPPASGGWFTISSPRRVIRDHQSDCDPEFGVEKPYIFQSGTSKNGMVGANPLADRAGHALRLIPVTKDEARFLSETLFWLDRIRSRSSKDDRFGGGMNSTADGSGTWIFMSETRNRGGWRAQFGMVRQWPAVGRMTMIRTPASISPTTCSPTPCPSI